MKLQIFKRAAERKSEAKKLRREGYIPAVMYQKGKLTESLAVKKSEFLAHLGHLPSGRLPTTVFTLVNEQGQERRAIVKEVQYKVTTYEVDHLDFEELVDDVKVNVKVPIECMGLAECVGVKLGGVVRQVIRHVRVRCLPKDIPSYFQLDIKELGLRQSKRLADIEMPATVRPLADLREVAIAIVKR